VETDLLGSIMLSGPGAGGDATASAVAGDIADIARGIALPVFGKPASSLAPYEQARMRRHEGGYYIALNLYDRPGAFASIANRMAECEISLQSVVQRENSDGARTDAGNKAMPVIIITHETNEKAIADALTFIKQDGNVVGEPKMIRIEKLS
ncbi:MAG: homoserine dehydrogenase, partial [Hyphomicrobiales bacterium]